MNMHPLRILIVALAFGLSASALARPALARSSFPSDPSETRKIVEKRVTAVWTTVERKLEGRHVSADRKREIRRMFDDAAKPVFDQLDRSSSDGTISKEEGNRIRALISGLRGGLRERLAAEHKQARSAGPSATRDAKIAESHTHALSAPPTDAASRSRARSNVDSVEDSERSRPRASHSHRSRR